MSLQIWLPLNGNINNQGLADWAPAGSSGIAYSTGGKIGNKCLNAGTVTASDKNYLGYEGSIAFWIFIDASSNSTAMLYGNGDTTASANNRKWSLFLYPDRNSLHSWGCMRDNSTSPNGSFFISNVLPDNTWTHVCVTHDRSNQYIYINGVLKSTIAWDSTGTFTFTNSTYLFADPAGNRLNDYRIYDHCLSAKEVKEISKGLILHYKLDNNSLGLPNLVTNSQRLSDLFSTAGTSLWSRTYTDENGTSVWTATCTTAGSGGVHTPLFSKTSDKIGKQYTWSCRIKANKNVSITVGSECGGLKRQDVTTEWQYITHTWTFADSTYGSFVWYIAEGSWAVGDWIKVRDLKIEEGNKATPWIPHTSDAEYTQLGLKSNVEYDCSGYGYHGTKYGNISISNSSCRYDVSYNFSNTNSYIVAPAINPTDFSNSFSFSWWGNLPDYKNKMMWGFADGNRLNLYSGIYNNTGDGYDNPFYSSGTTVINVPSVNTWHHFVLVGDGRTSKLYMDGNLYGTAKTYKAVTGYQIYISGWNAQTEYKCEGLVSDFRYYATALSATDVKELYNTSASIDKSGNIYAYGYKEE